MIDAYAGDDEMLARWRNARRVKALGGGTRPDAGTADEGQPQKEEAA